jgi:GNAT superfamily N-acetyltransferase
MQLTATDRIRMERAHVRAWPALQTAAVEGWLWRASGGGSQRANSVSTIDFTGNDLHAAIDTVETMYRTRGAPARFQTFDETSPATLAAALQARNYTPGETTMTMFKRPAPVAAPIDVEISDTPGEEWLDVYLGAITESRRTINRQILATIPAPSAFFTCRADGKVISTALCVIAWNCAVVECVATSLHARRQSGASRVMAALLAWAAGQHADLIGLQVVATNTPAVNLYQALGFVAGATNRFWLPATG